MSTDRQSLRQSESHPHFVVNFVVNFVGLLLLALFLPPVALSAPISSPLPPGRDNPSLARFARSIVLYVSFDGHALAEITPGNPAPQGNAGWVEALRSKALVFEPGVFGQALVVTSNRDCQVSYPCTSAVLRASGSIALWLKPVVLNHAGSYLWPVILDAAAGGYRVMFGRMGNPVNREALYAHLAHGGNSVNAVGGSMAPWKPGEWHLFIVSWDRNGVEFSVDGAQPARASLKNAIAGDQAGGFRLIALGRGEDTFIYDELMLLNVPLNKDEIRWLWECGAGADK